eukprot:c17212_g1_i2 orf=250-726(-)
MPLLRRCSRGVASLQRGGYGSRHMASRFFSSEASGAMEGWTLADELAEEEEVVASQPAVSRALDQMYSDLRFKKLAPGWLPLCPESSFFIPPSPPLSKIIKNHALSAHPPLSLNHLRVALNPLGWTSADAINHRMASQPEQKPFPGNEFRGCVEIIFL